MVIQLIQITKLKIQICLRYRHIIIIITRHLKNLQRPYNLLILFLGLKIITLFRAFITISVKCLFIFVICIEKLFFN